MLNIRVQKSGDEAFIAEILQKMHRSHCELKTAAGGGEEPDAATAKEIAFRFVNAADERGAFIYEDLPSGTPVGIVLYRCRNRQDAFPDYEVFGRLDPRLFPSGGRFLQVVLLWVHPGYRRLGLGSELLRRVEAEARLRQIRLLFLLVEGTNRPAMQLVRRLRYREITRGPVWDQVVRVSLIKRV
ncbi:MAG TPA: GNAT family N-acetyltransferase [Firmicutes bacterium]|nr:GNAT family N-acetyltransferase [Bacillota bacterium]